MRKDKMISSQPLFVISSRLLIAFTFILSLITEHFAILLHFVKLS